MNAKTIAEYFLSIESITQKKVQKLVYYAYSWYIVNNNENERICNKLFNEKPQAWVHGPVFPSLYEEYKIFGWDLIPKIDKIRSTITKDIETFLNEIWDVFGKYDGDQLELMTHNELPWIQARIGLERMAPSNNEIDDDIIYNYYSNLGD